MPGYKGMKQDKKNPDLKMAGDVADGTAQKMAQDKKMMQPRKSGIYMDREEGKLPMDRVGKYYQDTNPKPKPPPPPRPGEKGYNEYITKKNAEKKKEEESGIVGTIKKYAKKADKYLTGVSGATGSGF